MRRAETAVLIFLGLLATVITVANTVRLAPLGERQREDARAVHAYVREHERRVPFGIEAHVGRPLDTACAIVGLSGRVRVCVLVAHPARGGTEIRGGWRAPAASQNRPEERYGCYGRARTPGRCPREA